MSPKPLTFDDLVPAKKEEGGISFDDLVPQEASSFAAPHEPQAGYTPPKSPFQPRAAVPAPQAPPAPQGDTDTATLEQENAADIERTGGALRSTHPQATGSWRDSGRLFVDAVQDLTHKTFETIGKASIVKQKIYDAHPEAVRVLSMMNPIINVDRAITKGQSEAYEKGVKASVEMREAEDKWLKDKLGVNKDSDVGQFFGGIGDIGAGVTKAALLGPAALPVFSLEGGIDKAAATIEERNPDGSPKYTIDRAVAAGALSTLTAGAIMAISGGAGKGAAGKEAADKAYKTLLGLVARKAATGTAMGVGFGLGDLAVDRFILNKDMSLRDVGAHLLQSIKTMLGYELAGLIPEGRRFLQARAVTREYASSADARADLVPKAADALSRWTDAKDKAEEDSARKEYDDLIVKLNGVTYAVKAGSTFKGTKRVLGAQDINRGLQVVDATGEGIHANDEGQVQENQGEKHQGGDEVRQGEGEVRQAEGADQKAPEVGPGGGVPKAAGGLRELEAQAEDTSTSLKQRWDAFNKRAEAGFDTPQVRAWADKRLDFFLKNNPKAADRIMALRAKLDLPRTIPRLPEELSKATPNYGFGKQFFKPIFKNPLDMALYIVAQKKPSKADGKYMSYLRQVFPGEDDLALRGRGVEVRANIKKLAQAQGGGGDLPIPDQGHAPDPLKEIADAKAKAPAQAPAREAEAPAQPEPRAPEAEEGAPGPAPATEPVRVEEPPPAPAAPVERGEDRRQVDTPVDIDRRGAERRAQARAAAAAEKPVEEMTHEERGDEIQRLRAERLMDERIPEMPNGRAFDRQYKPGDPVASLDVKGLKKANENGQEVGTEFLVYIGKKLHEAAKKAGLVAAHISGDEFKMTGASQEDVDRVVQEVNEDLKKNPFRATDANGKKIELGGELHAGTGESPEAADRAMAAAKVARKALEPTLDGKVPEALKGVPGLTVSGRVFSIPTENLNVNPKELQYKEFNEVTGGARTNKNGATGSLQGVKAWDPMRAGVLAVWVDPRDGKTYVVNGHNRYDKALELGVKDLDVQFINAKTPREAMAQGALLNLAEGHGTDLDAAAFFRGKGIKSAKDLEPYNLPINKSVVENGLALASLPDEWFSYVGHSNNKSVVRLAVEAGKAGLSEPQAQAALGILNNMTEKKGRSPGSITSDAWAETLVSLKGATAKAKGGDGQLALFETNDYETNLPEQGAIVSGIKANLRNRIEAGAVAGKGKFEAARKEMGMTTATDPQAIVDRAKDLLAHLTDNRFKAGVGDEINDLADRVKSGELTEEEAVREAQQRLIDDFDRTYEGTSKGRGSRPPEPEAAPEAPAAQEVAQGGGFDFTDATQETLPWADQVQKPLTVPKENAEPPVPVKGFFPEEEPPAEAPAPKAEEKPAEEPAPEPAKKKSKNPFQKKAKPEAPKPDGYSNGDAIRYTGKTHELHGGIWHEFEYLEGAKKGETGVTPAAKVPEEIRAKAEAPSPLPPKGKAKPEEPAKPEAKLPQDLKGAKPRYNIGTTSYNPVFESDLDRALFIVAQEKPSKSDEKYMGWLREQMPGADDAEIRARGAEVRKAIKKLAQGQPEGGDLKIPSQGAKKAKAAEPEAPAPAAEKPAKPGTPAKGRAQMKATVQAIVPDPAARARTYPALPENPTPEDVVVTAATTAPPLDMADPERGALALPERLNAAKVIDGIREKTNPPNPKSWESKGKGIKAHANAMLEVAKYYLKSGKLQMPFVKGQPYPEVAGSMVGWELPRLEKDLDLSALRREFGSPHLFNQACREYIISREMGANHEAAMVQAHSAVVKDILTRYKIGDHSEMVERVMSPLQEEIYGIVIKLVPLVNERRGLAEMAKAEEEGEGGSGTDAQDALDKFDSEHQADMEKMIQDKEVAYKKAWVAIRGLAAKSEDVRVALWMEPEKKRPLWLKDMMQGRENEMKAAEEMTDLNARFRDAGKKVGLRMRNEEYITHLFKPIDAYIADTTADGQRELETMLDFHHRDENSVNLMPSVHAAMSYYVPTICRKLARQPILNMWLRNENGVLSNKSVYSDPNSPYYAKHFGAWLENDINEWQHPQHPGELERGLRWAKQVEMTRILGANPRVALKHVVSKMANNAAIHRLYMLPAMKDYVVNQLRKGEDRPLIGTAFKNVTGKALDLGGLKGDDAKIVQALYSNLIQRRQIMQALTEDPLQAKYQKPFFNSFFGNRVGNQFYRGVAEKAIKAGRKVRSITGEPVATVEAMENFVNVAASLRRGGEAGLTPEQQIRGAIGNILDISQRGGADASRFTKGPLGQLSALSQTPSKMWEFYGNTIRRAMAGEKDIYGTSGTKDLISLLAVHGALIAAGQYAGKKAGGQGLRLWNMLYHTPFINPHLAGKFAKAAYHTAMGHTSQGLQATASAVGDMANLIEPFPINDRTIAKDVMTLFLAPAALAKGTPAVSEWTNLWKKPPSKKFASRAHYLAAVPTEAEERNREALATRAGMKLIKSVTRAAQK